MTDGHLEEHAARAVHAGRMVSGLTRLLAGMLISVAVATLVVVLYSEDQLAHQQHKLTELAQANQRLLGQRSADQQYANRLVIELQRRADASDQYIEKAIIALYNALRNQKRLVLPPLPSPAPALAPPPSPSPSSSPHPSPSPSRRDGGGASASPS